MNEDETFALLEAAAVNGARCPMNQPFGPLYSTRVTALAHAGRIRIEVYRNNWRVITILTGEHAGKATAPPPVGGARHPTKVIDQGGTCVNGKPIGVGGNERGPKRPGPSAPRDYSVPHGLRDLKEGR